MDPLCKDFVPECVCGREGHLVSAPTRFIISFTIQCVVWSTQITDFFKHRLVMNCNSLALLSTKQLFWCVAVRMSNIDKCLGSAPPRFYKMACSTFLLVFTLVLGFLTQSLKEFVKMANMCCFSFPYFCGRMQSFSAPTATKVQQNIIAGLPSHFIFLLEGTNH